MKNLTIEILRGLETKKLQKELMDLNNAGMKQILKSFGIKGISKYKKTDYQDHIIQLLNEAPAPEKVEVEVLDGQIDSTTPVVIDQVEATKQIMNYFSPVKQEIDLQAMCAEFNQLFRHYVKEDQYEGGYGNHEDIAIEASLEMHDKYTTIEMIEFLDGMIGIVLSNDFDENNNMMIAGIFNSFSPDISQEERQLLENTVCKMNNRQQAKIQEGEIQNYDLKEDELFKEQCKFIVDEIEGAKQDSITDGFGSEFEEDDIFGMSLDISHRLVGKFFVADDYEVDLSAVDIFCDKLQKVRGLNGLLDRFIEDIVDCTKASAMERDRSNRAKTMSDDEFEDYLKVDPEECPF